jgi:hypothetical protein
MPGKSKLQLGCYGSILAIGLGYFAWVSFPPSRYESEAAAILSRRKERFESHQNQAREVGKNAFSDPHWVEYWGRQNREYRPNSPVEQGVQAMRQWSVASEWKATHLEKALTQKDPALLQAVADFEAWFPKLCQVLKQPCFVAPEDQPPSMNTIMPNWLAFRSIAHGLSAYSEVCLLRHQPDKALEVASQIFELEFLLTRDSDYLLQSMVGLSVQAIGSQTLAYLLQEPGLKWPISSLERLAQTLEKTQLPQDLMIQALEMELFAAQNTLQEFHKGPANDAWLLRFLPGLLQREWRLYKNDYVPMLMDVAAQRPPQSPSSKGGATPWLLGQHGYVSDMMIPNLNKAILLSRLAQQRQAFVHLYVRLLILQLQKQLPDSLQAAAIKPLAGLNLNQVSYRSRPLRLSLQLEPELSAVSPETFDKSISPRWQSLSGPNWLLPKENR